MALRRLQQYHGDSGYKAVSIQKNTVQTVITTVQVHIRTVYVHFWEGRGRVRWELVISFRGI
jgi:hypothetical protein